MSGYFASAYLEALLVGALAGLSGVIVVLRRRTFFANALTHATFPGAVVAALIGANVLAGSAVFAVLLAGIMSLLVRVKGQGRQTASGVVLAGGFALGTLLTTLNPSLPIHVSTYLVGSILSVSSLDTLLAGILLVIVAVSVAVFWRQLLFSTFDAAGYRAAGFRPAAVEAGVLAIIAATVVVMMPAVGAILAIALLAGPPLAARALAGNIVHMMWLSPLLGALSGIAGLWLSGAWGLAAGASIAVVSALVLLLALAVRGLATWFGAARHR